MRAAGKDGTKLFGMLAITRGEAFLLTITSSSSDFKHSWVNVEAMLLKCFVGYYIGDA